MAAEDADSLLALRTARGFDLIMADPPWRFATRSDRGRGRSAERHYSTMSLDEIEALPIPALAAADAILWLWATAPMFDAARALVDAWGFRYSTQGAWVKTTKGGGPACGTGYRLRSAHEPFLIATRGKPPRTRGAVRSAILAPRREHSRKPDEAYVAAAALAAPDATRLDLFARETRPGWTAWGAESAKFDRGLICQTA